MLRKLLALAVVLGGAFAVHQLVWVPYSCNVKKGEARRALERARAGVNPFRVRPAGIRNIETLERCRAVQPDDPDLIMVVGDSLEAAGRLAAAREIYCGGLQRNGSFALLHMACAHAQLLTGQREAAVQTFARVGEYAGPGSMWNVLDADVRWEVMNLVGERRAAAVAAAGELTINGAFDSPGSSRGMTGTTTLSGRSPSAAKGWDLVNPAAVPISSDLIGSPKNGENALLLRTAAAGAGLRQELTIRRQCVHATASIYVYRGTVCLSLGEGGSLARTACSRTLQEWEFLEGFDDGSAGEVSLTAISLGGAEFQVDEVRVRAAPQPLCSH